jgi:hypothetical protein
MKTCAAAAYTDPDTVPRPQTTEDEHHKRHLQRNLLQLDPVVREDITVQSEYSNT